MNTGSENPVLLARQALNQNDRPAAVRHLRAALERNPGDTEAWVMLAQAIDNPDHARKALERALRLQPDHAAAKRLLRQLGESPAKPLAAVERPATPEPSSRPVEPAGKSERGEARAIPARTPPPAPPVKPESRFPIEIVLGLIALCLLCVVGGLLASSGLERLTGLVSGAQVEPTLEDVTGVVYANMRAVNSENLVAYMATIHPDSTAYATTETGLRDAFELFDLSYTLLELTVIEQSSSEATVAFVLRTEKVSGPAFRDNVITGRWILRKDDGVWKILGQEIEDVQYLN